MASRVFIWVGHPRQGSLCEGLADAYQAACEASGAQVRRMNLSAMRFDMEAFVGSGDVSPPLEPDLRAWQEHIAWADHLLVVHPCWWGSMPAKAKAVLDRALSPGFGFRFKGRGVAWDRLLAGRTADVIITSDTPPLLDSLLYGRPSRRVMANQVLGFCGIRTRAVRQLGSVRTASPETIARWLASAGRMGTQAASPMGRLSAHLFRETGVSSVVSAVISFVAAWLTFRGEEAVESAAMAFDALPQTFFVALASMLIPALLTARRIRIGRLDPGPRAEPRPTLTLLLSVLCLAAGLALLAWLIQGYLLALTGQDAWDPLPFLAAKTTYGGLLAACLTPLAIRFSIRRRPASKQPSLQSGGSACAS